jgi:protein subunit release factor B
MTKKELLFSITKDSKDLRWDYYRGSGKGGQKRNKTENCCRVTHLPSGAAGKSEEGRSKLQNRKKALRRMAETRQFRDWVYIEAARISGEQREIEQRVERSMLDVITEVRVDGRWVEMTIKEQG